MILQGMNRERAPFVLTPDFEYVLGKRVGVVGLHVVLFTRSIFCSIRSCSRSLRILQ